MSPKPPPGAGTGYVRFDEGPLTPPPAPLSAQPVAQVLSPGPPASCATPLPVGQVVDSVADQLRALELLSSFMDPLRLRRFVLGWFPPLRLSLLSLSSPPTSLLHKNRQTSVRDKKSYRLNFLSNGPTLRKRSVCLRVWKLIWLVWLGKHRILMKNF